MFRTENHNAVSIANQFALMRQLSAEVVTASDQSEVLAFLSERPLHNVAMAGFIRDNGLVSPLNRGTFYSYRDEMGKLEGIALIGHATLVDARSRRALEAFARLAQNCSSVHMLLGEEHLINDFCTYYGSDAECVRKSCRELLFESRYSASEEVVPGLRLATEADLDLILPVHAEMAFAESGINPLGSDPDGFRERCLRRIQKNRTWIWTEDNKLIFKADIVAETSEAVYIEGVWISKKKRKQGLAARCLKQITSQALAKAEAVCVLVNENNSGAQALYSKSGFKLLSVYKTVFLN